MGTLNKYFDAAAVEEALDKGVAAYDQAEENKTDILSLKGIKINNVTITGELDSQTDLKIAGKIVTGTVYQIDGKDVTAANGAEVFNSSINKASGANSHAEGYSTTASGSSSHAEGGSTTASGHASHAEGGGGTTASGIQSHAEGNGAKAEGNGSHAEGSGTTASGNCSHAEGGGTTAQGDYSHAEGNETKASSNYQHVQGKYNIEDTNNKYAFIIGNGSSSNRSNAIAIDWDGKIYVGNSETGIDLNDLLNRIIALENK